MGRVKLQIKRIESTTNRQVTYSKRRNGLIKKAYELSILCDIDIALIMFSPSGRASQFSGEHRCIEDVISRYINLSDQERESPTSSNSDVEELQQEVYKLRQQLQMAEQQLRKFEPDPIRFTSMEEINSCEKNLLDTLTRITQRKEHLRKNHLSSYEPPLDQQDGIPTSFENSDVGGWLPESNGQNNPHLFCLPSESSIPQREMDGSITVYSSCFFEAAAGTNINVVGVGVGGYDIANANDDGFSPWHHNYTQLLSSQTLFPPMQHEIGEACMNQVDSISNGNQMPPSDGSADYDVKLPQLSVD
uniref:MADS-box 12 n=1 Tax=Momordica dioica TaxID=654836 RepID=A0A346NTP1_9ROSI|nr:MADS-box 12 [Momordica dioica]